MLKIGQIITFFVGNYMDFTEKSKLFVIIGTEDVFFMHQMHKDEWVAGLL